MISSQYFITNVLLLAVGTFLIRVSFISLSNKFVITPKIRELFTYIPAAILPALIIPSTFFHVGKVEWLLNHERFFIALIAFIVAYFYRNTLLVITIGLVLLFIAEKF